MILGLLLKLMVIAADGVCVVVVGVCSLLVFVVLIVIVLTMVWCSLLAMVLMV
jgi:hypothetical protein